MSLKHIPAGVVTGEQVQEIFAYAKAQQFALPAANVVGSNSVNAVLETAVAVNAPVILQFSNGGASFMAGKSLNNDGQRSAIAGAVSGARTMGKPGNADEISACAAAVARANTVNANPRPARTTRRQ